MFSECDRRGVPAGRTMRAFFGRHRKNRRLILRAVKVFGAAFCAKTLIAVMYVALLDLTIGRCPIRAATGVPCPACGLTRAWTAVLCGDRRLAFDRHPLWWLMPPLWILICIDGARLSAAAEKLRKVTLASIAVAFFIRWLRAYIL